MIIIKGRRRAFLILVACSLLMSGCGLNKQSYVGNASELISNENTAQENTLNKNKVQENTVQENKVKEKRVQESSLQESKDAPVMENEDINSTKEEGEQMDEYTQKMMAEGITTGDLKESMSEDTSDNEMVIEGYSISIMCPTELTKKKDGVEYGELIHTSYYSKTCEKDRNVNVLLPANYDSNKTYPVLYVLHGIFGDENSMIGDGKSGIPFILGNMMNEGLMKETIVVFPFMYASKDREQCTTIDIENVLAYDNFVNDLVGDLMPFLSSNYSVAEGKDATAVIGFSMGGREALAIGFYRPDLFGYVGSIAPAPGLIPSKDYAMEHPGQFAEDELVYEAEKPYLIMLCCGDDDKVVGTFPKVYHELFVKNEVDHIWWEVPGSDHGDPAISSGIYNFARYL